VILITLYGVNFRRIALDLGVTVHLRETAYLSEKYLFVEGVGQRFTMISIGINHIDKLFK